MIIKKVLNAIVRSAIFSVRMWLTVILLNLVIEEIVAFFGTPQTFITLLLIGMFSWLVVEAVQYLLERFVKKRW